MIDQTAFSCCICRLLFVLAYAQPASAQWHFAYSLVDEVAPSVLLGFLVSDTLLMAALRPLRCVLTWSTTSFLELSSPFTFAMAVSSNYITCGCPWGMSWCPSYSSFEQSENMVDAEFLHFGLQCIAYAHEVIGFPCALACCRIHRINQVLVSMQLCLVRLYRHM